MDQGTINELYERNRRIIEAVKAKEKLVCPGAVDLIAVTGSFASGEYYEKSDLDLLIVINNDMGWKIAKAFIIGDIGYDIYCQTWDGLERAAGYPDPHVIKLMNADIVYTARGAGERYLSLRNRLKETLAEPFCLEDLEKAERYYNLALETLGRLFLSDGDGECKYLSAVALYYIEYAVYMANKAYVRHGIRGIPEEIGAMERLPAGFMAGYHKLIAAEGDESVKGAVKALMKLTGDFLAALRNETAPKPGISAKELEGAYEEAFSNWRWKMHRAAELDSPYLSLMTAASCQNYYDEFYAGFDVPRFDLFSGFSVKDLQASAEEFDRVLGEFGELCGNRGADICRYPGLEEFEKDYLRQ